MSRSTKVSLETRKPYLEPGLTNNVDGPPNGLVSCDLSDVYDVNFVVYMNR